MRITVEQLERLLARYHGIEIRYLDDLQLRTQRLAANSFAVAGHPALIRQAKIREVPVVHTKSLYTSLNAEFPADFRKPYATLPLMEIDRMLDRFKMVNAQSRRKRRLHLVGDIYGIDVREGTRSLVLEHGGEVDAGHWNDVKRAVGREHLFAYRHSEVPIIIFVDLSMNAESGYVDRFMRNTTLISVMVSHPLSRQYEIAPDFIPTEDILSVTDPEALLDEYIRSNARLIIIGEKLNDAYKKALIKVRQYDKFVRMLVVPQLDQRSMAHFFQQVKLVYNADRWNE